jgi:hypothetical protein
VSWTACKLLHVESLVCLTAMEETRGPKVNFFSPNSRFLSGFNVFGSSWTASFS